MIKKLMRRFGFMTFEEHHQEMEQFREECEQFARDYLTAGHGFSIQTPGQLINGEIDSHCAIIASNVLLHNVVVRKGVVSAPWTKEIVLQNVAVLEDCPEYPKVMPSFIYAKGENFLNVQGTVEQFQ